MPRLTDVDLIRTRLRHDPVWAVYALGDLSPAMFDKTLWFEPDLTLVLHDYGTCILWAAGTASLREALGHVTWPVHLQVQDEALATIERHVHIAKRLTMWRMGLDRGAEPRCRSIGTASAAVRLSASDVPALVSLYADGEAAGESPDFFFPSMVTDGAFCGIYEGEALVAVAGTHLLSPTEGIAAIGNVYTRRDRRGRGLSKAVTAALVRELDGIGTIGLNVRADNGAALSVYESLGFARHVAFTEALATGWKTGATH